MPPGSTKYTLVGFAAELDWRPLSFVKPIPANRVCSTCGLVCKKGALLPCLHMLCASCYNQCGKEGLPACPLDGHELQDEDDVDWKDIPADQVLNREVRCWNQEGGCEAVVPASALVKHVLNECKYHISSCPRCSATVLHSNASAHLRSGCMDHIFSRASDVPLEPEETATSTAFERFFHKSVTEMGVGLRQIVGDSTTHVQALNDVCHAVNTLKEVLGQKFAEAAEENRGSFAQNADISRSVIKEVQDMFSVQGCEISSISQHVNYLKQTLSKYVITAVTQNPVPVEENAVKIGEVQTEIRKDNENATIIFVDALRCMLFNTAVAPLITIANTSTQKGIVMNQGKHDFLCDPVYLRGYCISPIVHLMKYINDVVFCIAIQLNRGVIDDVLLWPFWQSVKLSFIHPDSSQKKEFFIQSSKGNLGHFPKPAAPEGSRRRMCSEGASLSYLEREGYVKDDKLVLRYELV